MGKHPTPPVDLHELRVLVLHNRDFDPDQGAGLDDPDFASRADVLNAARDVARALCSRGHFVEIRPTDTHDIPDLLRQLKDDRPDLVFNLCESLGGDARNEVVIPTLLDLLQIPYTGSGPLALGLALRKERTKEVLLSAGVPTPPWVVLPAESSGPADRRRVCERGLPYPLIVKPTREDASVGISPASVVEDDDALAARVQALRQLYRQPVLVERYVPGREIYASLLGADPPRVLPLHEIDFSLMPSGRPHIVCYEAKWNPSSPEYAGTRPTQAGVLPQATQAAIEGAARAAFAALGLSDYARCDVRLADDGTPYVIDINPNCDLSDGAGFSLAARLGGLSYDRLIEQIAACALQRSHQARGQRLARLHVLESQGAARGPIGARGEGRSILGDRDRMRPRSHRQRAI